VRWSWHIFGTWIGSAYRYPPHLTKRVNPLGFTVLNDCVLSVRKSLARRTSLILKAGQKRGALQRRRSVLVFGAVNRNHERLGDQRRGGLERIDIVADDRVAVCAGVVESLQRKGPAQIKI